MDEVLFQDFTKHYENIRSILRDIFLYGCYTKSQLENQNKISSRKLNYEIRRIEQYIDKEFFTEDRDGRVKLLSLTYDSISNTKNFLVDTYLSKSFTRADIVLFYGILLVLNEKDECMSLAEIIQELIDNDIIDIDEISSKTVERKVKELNEDIKIIDCTKNGKTKYYKISEDILKELSSEDLEKLYYVSELYKNILFPNMAGYFFTETLSDYIEFERKETIKKVDSFQYKNLHFHPIIEENVLWQGMSAIREKKIIILEYEGKSRRHGRYNEVELKPYKIRYDVKCGRFYLVSFSKGGRCIVSRLDRIRKIKITKKTYTEDLKQNYYNAMHKSWSSVPANSENVIETLEFKIVINDNKDMYIKEKILSEVGKCYVKHINKNELYIRKEVNDIYEMIPWLRGYAGYIQIISPKWVRKKINKDLKEMLKNYGIIS